MHIYRHSTEKPIDLFVKDLSATARERGFFIHNEDKMDMAQTFGHHGVEVPEGFDVHMIQICKPEKAAKSLAKNPERAVLMPKFVMAFTQEGKTHIRFHHYSREVVAQLVDDEEFPDSLAESFGQIIGIIEAAS